MNKTVHNESVPQADHRPALMLWPSGYDTRLGPQNTWVQTQVQADSHSGSDHHFKWLSSAIRSYLQWQVKESRPAAVAGWNGMDGRE